MLVSDLYPNSDQKSDHVSSSVFKTHQTHLKHVRHALTAESMERCWHLWRSSRSELLWLVTQPTSGAAAFPGDRTPPTSCSMAAAASPSFCSHLQLWFLIPRVHSALCSLLSSQHHPIAQILQPCMPIYTGVLTTCSCATASGILCTFVLSSLIVKLGVWRLLIRKLCF